MVDKSSIPPNVKSIMDKLTQNGFEAYIIGGWVRDLMLGLDPHDLDIFTNANGKQLLELFPTGKVIGGPERQSKILTVVVDGIEISQYRSNGDRTQTGKSLLKHLSTCDFCLNSIAMDKGGNIVDPNKGAESVRMQEFGFVGIPQDRIQEDPLRILRAVRFMVKLGFSFKHIGALKEYGHLIGNLPKERIREEFLKIIEYDGGLERLISLGLIKYIIPKFVENVGVPGGPYHNETVDQHLIYAFNLARKVTDNKLLWLTALFHDIGKAESFSCADGTAHFFSHEEHGAKYTATWMTEMGFAVNDTRIVVCLIRNHMWQYNDTLSKRSFVEKFRDFSDNGVSILDFIMLKYCDHQANMLNPRVKVADFLKNSPLTKKYYQLKYSKEPFKVDEMEINGQDILALGYKQGPLVGNILKEIFDKIMDGVLVNQRPVLMNYLREHYEKGI